jgi:hypothetical protein
MAGEDVKRIIKVPLAPPDHGVVGRARRYDSDGDGCEWSNISSCRGDSDQTDYCAGGCAKKGWFAMPPGQEDPGQTGGCGCSICGNERIRSETVCGKGAARVETEPTEPQESRPDNDHRDVIGFHIVFLEAFTDAEK